MEFVSNKMAEAVEGVEYVKFIIKFNEQAGKVFAVYNPIQIADSLPQGNYFNRSGERNIMDSVFDSRYEMLIRLMQLDSAEFTRNILNYGIDISLIDEKQVNGWGAMLGHIFAGDLIEGRMVEKRPHELGLPHECLTLVADERSTEEDGYGAEVCSLPSCGLIVVKSALDRIKRIPFNYKRIVHLYDDVKSPFQRVDADKVNAAYIKQLHEGKQLITRGSFEAHFGHVYLQKEEYCAAVCINHSYDHVPKKGLSPVLVRELCDDYTQSLFDLQFVFPPFDPIWGDRKFRMLFKVADASSMYQMRKHLKGMPIHTRSYLEFMYLALTGERLCRGGCGEPPNTHVKTQYAWPDEYADNGAVRLHLQWFKIPRMEGCVSCWYFDLLTDLRRVGCIIGVDGFGVYAIKPYGLLRSSDLWVDGSDD